MWLTFVILGTFVVTLNDASLVINEKSLYVAVAHVVFTYCQCTIGHTKCPILHNIASNHLPSPVVSTPLANML